MAAGGITSAAEYVAGLRSGRSDADAPERSLLRYLDLLDREMELWRQAADNDRWERYVRLYGGRQQITGTPKFLANIIRPTIDRRNALLTEQKPAAKILPWRNGLEALAETLEKLFEADWQATGMSLGIEEMVQLASVMGSAGIDLAWNKSAQFGQGAIDPAVLDPRQVAFDPIVRRSRLLDQAQYIRIETVKNLWDIQRDYPVRGSLVVPDAGVSSIASSILTPMQGSVASRIATSFQSRMAKLEDGPIPRKIIKEYWLRDPARRPNGEYIFPLGRTIERGGEVILDDGPNPYWDGLWSAEWFDLVSDINSPWGRSQVDALRYISDAVNRIGNLFVENSILAGNVVVLYDSDAMTNETRAKLANASALVVPKKFGRNVEWRPPPAMPPHMLSFITWALALVDYLVGMRDASMEGKGRVELRSGIQLEGLQNAGQILVKQSARKLEGFLERLGQKWLSRVFQFYTGSRMMHYLGPNNDWKSWQFNYAEVQQEYLTILKADGKDTTKTDSLRDIMQTAWQHFAFKVRPLSTLAATKIARAQLLMQLVEAGIMPRDMILREVGYDNPEELMNRAAAQAQQYGPPQPSRGTKNKK